MAFTPTVVTGNLLYQPLLLGNGSDSTFHLLVLRTELAGWSLMSDLLSPKVDWWSEGLGFKLCVVLFPNVCVLNFKLVLVYCKAY